tara:strand:+ start:1305 stop:1865 length:561 start_codon:yes stop_codon:yes gene_type:complete
MIRFKRIHTIYSNVAKNNNINNYPGADVGTDPSLTESFIWNNLLLLYQNCINPLLDEFGSSIKITSAYRSKALNSFLGGTPNSQHIKGYAVDLVSHSHPSSTLWNWCFQNLPKFNQLIWEYPEKGNFAPNQQEFSHIHISYTEENNKKATSISSEREDLHEMYQGELTNKIGKYTHGITLADENLL